MFLRIRHSPDASPNCTIGKMSLSSSDNQLVMAGVKPMSWQFKPFFVIISWSIIMCERYVTAGVNLHVWNIQIYICKRHYMTYTVHNCWNIWKTNTINAAITIYEISLSVKEVIFPIVSKSVFFTTEFNKQTVFKTCIRTVTYSC